MTIENSAVSTEFNIKKRRKVLQEILDIRRFDLVAKMEGIKLHRKTNKDDIEEDCTAFAFGLRGDELRNEKMRLFGEYRETPDPIPGDFVLYCKRTSWDPEEFRHIGIFLGNGFVRSKWGQLDVYDHPTLLVPYDYGNIVKFVKRP